MTELVNSPVVQLVASQSPGVLKSRNWSPVVRWVIDPRNNSGVWGVSLNLGTATRTGSCFSLLCPIESSGRKGKAASFSRLQCRRRTQERKESCVHPFPLPCVFILSSSSCLVLLSQAHSNLVLADVSPFFPWSRMVAGVFYFAAVLLHRLFPLSSYQAKAKVVFALTVPVVVSTRIRSLPQP